MTHEELKRKFSMPVGVINGILKSKHKYYNIKKENIAKKNIISPNVAKVIYEPLYEWIENRRSNSHRVTNDMIKNYGT
ncbi:hypothetical protein A3Q56_08388 [Intoshia linei]|uniref:Uncharacterized protein n=1 Tax=Intoshia linei TaxID=1819745 RepID=A0A177APJ4_9BILA|nr:hypothetical protein A3Q56_08388 [Intoshia linei]